MDRDLEQQYMQFIGHVQNRPSYINLYRLKSTKLKDYYVMISSDNSIRYTTIEIETGDLHAKSLSDRFFDINSPTQEELEMFYIEDEEACNILFLNKKEHNGRQRLK